MLHIILLILKTIGCILAAIIGIALLLLLLILFVPVKYKHKGSFEKVLYSVTKVTYLGILFRLAVHTDEHGMKMAVRILGIPVYRTDGKEKRQKKKKVKRKKEKAADAKGSKKPDLEEIPVKEETKQTDRIEDKSPVNTEKDFSEKKGFFARVKEKIEKLKYTFRSFCDKIKNGKEMVKKFFGFIKEEENKVMFRFLKGQAFLLLKHIFPRKLKGEIVFGTGEPDTTGYILAAAAVFYPLYGKQIHIIPKFEEPVFQGTWELNGRVAGYRVLWILFQTYRNKQVKKLIQDIRRK